MPSEFTSHWVSALLSLPLSFLQIPPHLRHRATKCIAVQLTAVCTVAGGTDWKKTSLIAATLFPSILFGTGFIINFFIWGKHSSGAVPFTTMLILVFMWFGISVPLVLAGGFFGFRKEPYLFPVGTNQIHRQIPEQPSFLNPAVSMLLGGILPFGKLKSSYFLFCPFN